MSQIRILRPYECVGVQRRGSEFFVDTDTRGRWPARCDTVQVRVVPGNLKPVEIRERPPVLAEVLIEVRPFVGVDLRRRVITHVLSCVSRSDTQPINK
jgi:hypothetical protein